MLFKNTADWKWHSVHQLITRQVLRPRHILRDLSSKIGKNAYLLFLVSFVSSKKHYTRDSNRVYSQAVRTDFLLCHFEFNSVQQPFTRLSSHPHRFGQEGFLASVGDLQENCRSYNRSKLIVERKCFFMVATRWEWLMHVGLWAEKVNRRSCWGGNTGESFVFSHWVLNIFKMIHLNMNQGMLLIENLLW